jgi:GNAT superfamily N-acetyltransferase
MVLHFKITSESRPRPEDMAAIENAVYRHNMTLMNDWAFRQVAIFLRDDGGRVMGGALGGIWGGWMHLTFLWVTEALRGNGYGSQLLARAEDQARERNCRGVFLETHSFQAKPFYERRGYVVVGQIDDYPQGHSYYMMCKRLDG